MICVYCILIYLFICWSIYLYTLLNDMISDDPGFEAGQLFVRYSKSIATFESLLTSLPTVPRPAKAKGSMSGITPNVWYMAKTSLVIFIADSTESR